jgi:gliding motility-associated-like protein
LYVDSGGCDSLVIETIEFVAADTTLLLSTTCAPAEAGTFTTQLLNIASCDSLIIETITLLPSDTTVYQQLSCFQQDVGTIEELFINIFGCDSLLWTITTLAPDDSCIVYHLEKDIFIPNIFSPNGDGVNDYFFIQNNEGSVKNILLFSIFDRWGGLLLERADIDSNEPQQGWDGSFNGKPLSPGVYVWVARVQYVDDKIETLVGNVTLVR